MARLQDKPKRVYINRKKTDAIAQMEPPHTLKQLRFFVGIIHPMIKLFPNLSDLTATLRHLLSTKNNIKGTRLKWITEHDTAFANMKNDITNIIENKHFDTNKPTKARCGESKNGLGAGLEQQIENNWQPMPYACRSFNSNEPKYSKK